MKALVIWRLLTVGGVNAGWRNRAVYFQQHGIDTEYLYTTDHGGLHLMQDVARVYLTNDQTEIHSILRSTHYDAIIVVDTKNAYKWIRDANFNGPVIVEARTPELIKLTPHVQDFRGIRPVGIVVPSQFQKRLVSIVTDGIPINMIHNGVDTNFFRPLPVDEIDWNSDPMLPEGKRVIGWIGRLDKRKNWSLLLRIAQSVKRERKDVEFWVVGGAQSVQREEFASKWKEKQLTDIVKWFPVVPYQQMPHVYAKILRSGGCTLATTRGESFGNTFIESMACGVPVIAPGITSIPELVVHGETGFMYHEEDVTEAISFLNRVLDDDSLHARMSRSAMKRVEKQFAIDKVAKQYVHLLKNIVTDSPAMTTGSEQVSSE